MKTLVKLSVGLGGYIELAVNSELTAQELSERLQSGRFLLAIEKVKLVEFNPDKDGTEMFTTVDDDVLSESWAEYYHLETEI